MLLLLVLSPPLVALLASHSLKTTTMLDRASPLEPALLQNKSQVKILLLLNVLLSQML